MKKLIILSLTLTALMACKKEITKPRSGIFRGTFTMTGSNGGGIETGDCTIALNDVQESYVLSVDTSAQYPYNCSGSFFIVDDTKMKFSSNYLAPDGGDQNIILDSVYSYVFDDTRFEAIRQIDTILYEYKFIRY